MIRAIGLTIAAVLCLGAAQESRLEEYFRLRKEAGTAAQAGDLAKAEALSEQALVLYPASPGSLLRLARIEMAAGKPEEALAHMAAYADLGLTWNVAMDDVLKPLIARPDYGPVDKRLDDNNRPTGQLTTHATFIRPGSVFEGLARTGDAWLVSSVTERTIFRVDGDKLLPFLKGDAETGAVFGLAVDEKRGLLWAAEAAGPGIPGSAAPARTAVLKIDLKTGAILARYPAPDDGKPHQLGDVALAEDGTVFASDAVGALIYRLKPGGAALEVLVRSAEIGSPQGMVACGRDALLVADYPTGLHRIDLKSGLAEPVGGKIVALAGTDGLFRVRHDFRMRSASPLPHAVVATQNGVSPNRLVMLRISPDCREIEASTVLASNHQAINDLTLGVGYEGGAAFVGRGGWVGYGGDGKPVDGDKPGPALILSVALPAD